MDAVVAGPGDALPLVVTFRQSPAIVLSSRPFPGFLLSWRQKLSLLERLGIEAVAVIDFSEEISNLSGKAFIGLLKDSLAIQKIVVGHNFRFGKDRKSGTDELKQMLFDTGTEVQVTEPVLWGDSIVSSSRIRKTIKDADFCAAKAMLAAGYSLDLRGIPVRAAGEETLRIARSDLTQVLPKPGNYAVACTAANGKRAGRLVVGVDTLTLAAATGEEITTVEFD